MTDQEHHQAALQFAELLEAIDTQVNVAAFVHYLPFEEIDRAT